MGGVQSGGEEVIVMMVTNVKHQAELIILVWFYNRVFMDC